MLVILTTNYLGAEGRGTISLILTSIAILVLFSNIIGGTVLVYLVPRAPLFPMLVLSAIWSILMSAAGTYTLYLFHLVDNDFIIHIFILTFINSLASNNIMVLLAKENIKASNILNLMQAILLLIIMSVSFLLFHYFQIRIYILALYISYLTVFIVGSILVSKHVTDFSLKGIISLFNQMLSYGLLVQTASILSLLIYRMSYYMIESYSGRAEVGIFSVGVSLSEGVWLVGGSIALNLFSKVANTQNNKEAQQLTAKLTRLALLISTILLAGVLLLPESVFSFVFGKDFSGVKPVMLFMSIGIVLYSINMVINHYFSGTGMYRYCTTGALIGFLLILLFNFLLIPHFGSVGAGASSSLAYTGMTIYQIKMFKKESGLKTRDLIPTRADLKIIINQIISPFIRRTK